MIDYTFIFKKIKNTNLFTTVQKHCGSLQRVVSNWAYENGFRNYNSTKSLGSLHPNRSKIGYIATVFLWRQLITVDDVKY